MISSHTDWRARPWKGFIMALQYIQQEKGAALAESWGSSSSSSSSSSVQAPLLAHPPFNTMRPYWSALLRKFLLAAAAASSAWQGALPLLSLTAQALPLSTQAKFAHTKKVLFSSPEENNKPLILLWTLSVVLTDSSGMLLLLIYDFCLSHYPPLHHSKVDLSAL